MNDAAQRARRFFTELLRMIYRDTQARNESPLDHIMLWGAMKRLGYQVGKNKVKDALDHFLGRSWVTFEVQENEDTGTQLYTKIKIAPEGRIAIKGLKPDETVEIEAET